MTGKRLRAAVALRCSSLISTPKRSKRLTIKLFLEKVKKLTNEARQFVVGFYRALNLARKESLLGLYG